MNDASVLRETFGAICNRITARLDRCIVICDEIITSLEARNALRQSLAADVPWHQRGFGVMGEDGAA